MHADEDMTLFKVDHLIPLAACYTKIQLVRLITHAQ
jgi:hypothetical protein